MEFYLDHPNINDLFRQFQFPTGWNSTLAFGFFCKRRACFNSQRDEILQSGVFATKVRAQFQFPTGWNSTDSSFTFWEL